MRITGGLYNGRELFTPKTQKTRPSAARLRQALFNSIQAQIPEANCLDLFAGSGSLGFEALSRGASSIHFIETDRQALDCISKNADLLGVKKQVTSSKSWESIAAHAPYDLVFCDPPYRGGHEKDVLEMPWQNWLKEGGLFFLEWSPLAIAALPEVAPNLVKIREKNYGDSVLTTFRYTAS